LRCPRGHAPAAPLATSMGNQPPKHENFETGVRSLLTQHSIAPWNARELIREKLELQAHLARKSPLREVPVQEGLEYFRSNTRGPIRKQAFVTLCMDLLKMKRVWTTPGDRDELHDIFDSLDFDRSGELDRGEWAGGLSIFFQGTMDQCIRAVFTVLDTDKSNSLSTEELSEYLQPVVKAMVPMEAAPLLPMLQRQVTELIYAEMDSDRAGGVSSDEMVAWTQKGGNNLVNKVAEIIEKEVYRIWLQGREQDRAAGMLVHPSEIPGAAMPLSAQQQQGYLPPHMRLPSGMAPNSVDASHSRDMYGSGPTLLQSGWQQASGTMASTGWQQPGFGAGLSPQGWLQGPSDSRPQQGYTAMVPPNGWQQGPGIPPNHWQQQGSGTSLPSNSWQRGQGMPSSNSWPPQGYGATLPPQNYIPQQPDRWQQTLPNPNACQMGQHGQQWVPQQGQYHQQWQHRSGHKHGGPQNSRASGCFGPCLAGLDCEEDEELVEPSPRRTTQRNRADPNLELVSQVSQVPSDVRLPQNANGHEVWCGRGWGDSRPEGGEATVLAEEGIDWRNKVFINYPWNIPPPPPPQRGTSKVSERQSSTQSRPEGMSEAGVGEDPEAKRSSAPYTPCSTFAETSPSRGASPSFKSSDTYKTRDE